MHCVIFKLRKNTEIIKRKISKSKQEERINHEHFEEDCMVVSKRDSQNCEKI